MSEPLTTPFVFVSYSRADSEIATRLKVDLLARGIVTWIDEERIQPGTSDWEEAIRTAVHDAYAVLLIASPNARSSHYVRDELSLAKAFQRPVYPIWVEGKEWIDSIPLGWGRAQHIDARDTRYEKALHTIVNVLNDALVTSLKAPGETSSTLLSPHQAHSQGILQLPPQRSTSAPPLKSKQLATTSTVTSSSNMQKLFHSPNRPRIVACLAALLALLSLFIPLLIPRPHISTPVSKPHTVTQAQSSPHSTSPIVQRTQTTTVCQSTRSSERISPTTLFTSFDQTTPTTPADATSTANAQATQIAVQASATAERRATATAVVRNRPQDKPTADALLKSIICSRPIYDDSLTDGKKNMTVEAHWQQILGSCYFASNGFHVLATGYTACWESNYLLENLAITVDVTILSGNGGSGGLYFRFSTGFGGAYSGYLFEIKDDGQFKLSNNGDPFLDWGPDFPAIKKGDNVTNTLQVIAQDATLYYFVNGAFIAKWTDTDPYGAGEIALFANLSGTEVAFSNLKIYAA